MHTVHGAVVPVVADVEVFAVDELDTVAASAGFEIVVHNMIAPGSPVGTVSDPIGVAGQGDHDHGHVGADAGAHDFIEGPVRRFKIGQIRGIAVVIVDKDRMGDGL